MDKCLNLDRMQALVVRTSEEGDSAVAHAHKEKLRRYEARCSAEAITFLHKVGEAVGEEPWQG